MTRTAGAQIGCQRLSRFWGLGCPKIYHEAEDTLGVIVSTPEGINCSPYTGSTDCEHAMVEGDYVLTAVSGDPQ
ncbi:hypothetical protein, partial [Thiolapillus sp.]